MSHFQPHKPKLRLEKVVEMQMPSVPTLGLQPTGEKLYAFPFVNADNGTMMFSMNVVADSAEHAAQELRELLSAMLVEVSMQFPLSVPVPSIEIRCQHPGCKYTTNTSESMVAHVEIMHKDGKQD